MRRRQRGRRHQARRGEPGDRERQRGRPQRRRRHLVRRLLRRRSRSAATGSTTTPTRGSCSRSAPAPRSPATRCGRTAGRSPAGAGAAGIVVSSSGGADVTGNTVAWNADGIASSARAARVRPPSTSNRVRDNVVALAPQPGDGSDKMAVAWLQDWSGVLFSPPTQRRQRQRLLGQRRRAPVGTVRVERRHLHAHVVQRDAGRGRRRLPHPVSALDGPRERRRPGEPPGSLTPARLPVADRRGRGGAGSRRPIRPEPQLLVEATLGEQLAHVRDPLVPRAFELLEGDGDPVVGRRQLTRPVGGGPAWSRSPARRGCARSRRDSRACRLRRRPRTAPRCRARPRRRSRRGPGSGSSPTSHRR